ncbi:stage V sporulation T C-terminal domain-containing protein [Micrococcus sp. SIMBA_131]
MIAPIIANGDPIGTVILLAKEDEKVTELEQKLSETAAGFLARQMEQ